MKKNRSTLRFATLAAASIVLLHLGLGHHSADAQNRLDQADNLRLRGRYAEAIEIYSTEEALKENEVRAAWGTARCLTEAGQREEAAKTLEETLKKQPRAAQLLAELAHLAFDRGDLDAARQFVDKALALDEHQLLARWVTAQLHQAHGRMKEAELAYEWFIDYYNAVDEIDDPEAICWIGQAAAQYARWTRNSGQFGFLVNDLYPGAVDLDEAYWPAHLQSGLLFLEKYNRPDAFQDISAALKINPRAAEALAAKAAWALQDHKLDDATTSIERALEINPQLVWSHQLKADMLMADFRPGEAVAVLETARDLNPRDETTLGRLAAAYGLVDGLAKDPAGTRMGTLIDEAVARNEHCGEFYLTLAQSLDLLRRFPTAAQYYGEARRRMPQLVSVRGDLGMLLMRLGKEDEAERLLKASFEVDPFNVRVKNMLAVLEVLDGYETLETDHFLIRFDPKHDALLARYAADYLEREVYPEVCGDLDFKPPEKSLFEIFNRAKNTDGHGWFSARMVGLPYIGTVGACAGEMVAMASPNGLNRKYNWARVLKHEFVHVVNLQQTSFNIPHWLTEAMAVHFEGYPRPPEWNAVLAKRYRAGKLFDLGTLNRGFVRPSNGEDWTLAYCQAELYADYMIDRLGDDAPANLIAAYTEHRPTEDALQTAFDLSLEEFEDGYTKYVAKIADAISLGTQCEPQTLAQLREAYDDAPDNADLAAELALAYLKRKANTEARRYAKEAQELQPKHQLAAYVLARLYLSIGETRRAETLLQACLDEEARGDDPPQENALSLLAGLKLKAEDFAGAARWYQLGRNAFPHDVKWLKALSAVHLKAKNNKKLEATLTELSRLDADDPTVPKKLAQLAVEREDFAAAAEWANRALQIDVQDAQLHAWLAEAQVGLQRWPQAIQEYDVAVELAPTNLAWRFALADAHVQAGGNEKAKTVLDKLLEIDPDFPGADVLLESLQP